ncbi:ribosome maturation factor RimM [Paeniglutamicibacter sp. ABSL32-1]|uniref:ribosome maturation factor RimM n=1 Tax=Paeniglutamicibacter quisquiliarum TaxID=2849498 RepID=UPI001C2D027E|nr:ribosome maturation factor RimM [Paeniglutamicibacter quisquiliarum]MBV1778745.1 ribosome maturation factor RimM [Paeniglutamicibacter quisquiliarum]
MRLQVARIGKPHGIRGEVTVQVLTDAPQDRFVPGAVFEVEHPAFKQLTVEGARWNKEILLLAFEELLDRNAAETVRGAKLFIDTEEVEDDGEGWYEHELVDLEARVGDKVVGKVTALRTGNVQDLLVVESTEGDEIYVPFVESIVPEVNIEGGYILMTPPEGLFEINREDAAGTDAPAEEA